MFVKTIDVQTWCVFSLSFFLFGPSPSDCFIEVCVSCLFDCSGFITRVALHFIFWSAVVSTCISGLSLLKHPQQYDRTE